MEDLAVTPSVWRDTPAFVTGHTGFKGGWLCLALQQLGCSVSGYALAPSTDPSLFEAARIGDAIASSEIGDIRNAPALADAMRRAKPSIVFHLAAQALVRQSYVDPLETYATNVMGTANVLEAVRVCPSVKSVVIVTTDKCYHNNEWDWGYRETEPLGGHDPYSSSKACAELVTAAYRSSFLAERGVLVASARAGNVLGGGDWAADRLVPDFFRAADAGEQLDVRAPDAVRPWQHVLEPVMGYIIIAEALMDARSDCAEAWNFGPADADAQPVRWILDRLGALAGAKPWTLAAGAQVHEARTLKLDSSKAHARLGWKPRWNLEQALGHTVDWHRGWRAGDDARKLCLSQIASYRAGLVA